MGNESFGISKLSFFHPRTDYNLVRDDIIVKVKLLKSKNIIMSSNPEKKSKYCCWICQWCHCFCSCYHWRGQAKQREGLTQGGRGRGGYCAVTQHPGDESISLTLNRRENGGERRWETSTPPAPSFPEKCSQICPVQSSEFTESSGLAVADPLHSVCILCQHCSRTLLRQGVHKELLLSAVFLRKFLNLQRKRQSSSTFVHPFVFRLC